MKKGRAVLDGRILLVVLIILILIIFGLVIGIFAVNTKDQSLSKTEKTDYVLPEELKGDDLSPLDQVIKETSLMLQDPNVSNAKIEAYYDSSIEKAKNDEDNKLAIEIIIQKMNFLAVIEDDCAKAAEYVNNIDLQSYSVEEKSYLASYIVSMAASCKNQELQERWANLTIK